MRQSLRRRAPLSVLINFGMHYSRRWPVRDLSTDGAFVEMPASGMRVGMPIEFVLRFHAGDRIVEHRLPAIVERIGENGVGVKFGTIDNETYTDLVHLLYTT